jgi:hypothetical protein
MFQNGMRNVHVHHTAGVGIGNVVVLKLEESHGYVMAVPVKELVYFYLLFRVLCFFLFRLRPFLSFLRFLFFSNKKGQCACFSDLQTVIGTRITADDLRSGFKTWRKHTSTSPSGRRHLGYYHFIMASRR